jgi:hypothetical protein
MKTFLFLIVAVALCFGQIGGGGKQLPLMTPAESDSADQKVYVPSVPACTVIYYPVLRENLIMHRNDRVRIIFRIKERDSATFAELFSYDYKLKFGDSGTYILKGNLIP